MGLADLFKKKPKSYEFVEEIPKKEFVIPPKSDFKDLKEASPEAKGKVIPVMEACEAYDGKEKEACLDGVSKGFELAMEKLRKSKITKI